MTDEGAWQLIESLCEQTSDQKLMLTDRMAEKYGLVPYIGRVIPTWVRDDDLAGWISNERNPWSIINFDRPLL